MSWCLGLRVSWGPKGEGSEIEVLLVRMGSAGDSLRYRAQGLRFIEIVKGLGAKNVLSESFDRNVLSESFDRKF